NLKLRFTNRAATELDAVLSSLDRVSPVGAKRVRQRLQDTIDLLLRYPSAGRLTDKRQVRRVPVFPYPYVIFYRASTTEITIHAVRHSARKPPAPTTL
ncbi:MAG: type II toxin-antitoxin system RelE/ParE family toxin, partial [Beijerinckiaceae bacterium]|nr:type II toxin-antitoxin system RelE/ParE family toxin [Beijerinckiaceae bacterium]